MDLNKSIKHTSSKGKRKGFKGEGFKFLDEPRIEPKVLSPEIPWDDVSNLTINGKKIACTPLDLEVHELLGRGAYGIVHRMTHKATKTEMAVKRIPLTLNTNVKKQTFMDLDVSMRSGSCPFTVKFFGAMIEEGEVFICMELMDLSIEAVYKNAFEHGYKISEDFLRKLAFSVVSALLFLKTTLKVIHRDVKPSNILVNRKGEIKLCDFGVSGYLENSLAMTRIGCKFYMSPERIDPPEDCSGFSIKSDVWSFGISMIEVAKGKYPYDPWKDPFHQIKQVVEGPPPTLPQGLFSDELVDFVSICLVKEVSQRADYKTLLAHAFITEHTDPNLIDISKFIGDMIDLCKSAD